MRSGEVRHSQGGFTLIELAVVLVISGLMLAALLAGLQVTYRDIQSKRLQTTMEQTQNILKAFMADNDRYPCPADPSLPPTDPNYGMENCTTALEHDAAIENGVVKDADGNGVPDKIYIGIFPTYIKTGPAVTARQYLSFYLNKYTNQITDYLDPWGHPLGYAVSKNMTLTTAPFNANYGVIAVHDEYGNDTGGVHNNAHYVVFSHGENDLCPSPGAENENCDNDAVFTQGLQSYGNVTTHVHDAAGNTTFVGNLMYDDYISYIATGKETLWSKITGAGTGTSATGNVKNDNAGNIGIKTTTPQDKLDVAGVVKAQTSVNAQKFCDIDPATGNVSNCLDPSSIYSLSCPSPDQYISSVTLVNNKLTPICKEFEVAGTVAACPANKPYLRGFFSDGTRVCVAALP